ncbi:MAG TPA: RIO1 family regulatory kinase/ATPase [Acidimicrobiales bacterium]|nr:RIO1 family regulatory kinase/ATPase [Acidimicrobiales bacterium]
MPRPVPSWVLVDDYVDADLGTLKTGKEAEIRVVERIAADGTGRHLLAEKRYRPKTVTFKGELEVLGFTTSATFRNDVGYREARAIRSSRDRRAVSKMTRRGREVVRRDWVSHEFEVLTSLWHGGAPVPYPVATDHATSVLLEYLGDDEGAAPRLAEARLDRAALALAWDQLVDAVQAVVDAGWVHADLSAYNVLWWREQVWLIDVPQAVDLHRSTIGYELLHRDLSNVARWFAAQGVPADPDATLASLLR